MKIVLTILGIDGHLNTDTGYYTYSELLKLIGGKE